MSVVLLGASVVHDIIGRVEAQYVGSVIVCCVCGACPPVGAAKGGDSDGSSHTSALLMTDAVAASLSREYCGSESCVTAASASSHQCSVNATIV
jgi:hypothetical protein